MYRLVSYFVNLLTFQKMEKFRKLVCAKLNVVKKQNRFYYVILS